MVGANLTDGDKPGTKRHVVVDRRGTPLACLITPANRNEGLVMAELLDAVPELAGGLGVKMADPDREVYVMCGDGSYLLLTSKSGTL